MNGCECTTAPSGRSASLIAFITAAGAPAVQLGGKLAQIGSRLVVGAARKTADDFFESFRMELERRAAAQ